MLGEGRPHEHVYRNAKRSIELRATPEEKSLLARAAACERLDLTSFVMRFVLPAAEKIICRAERISLSERDTKRVLDLLDDPPRPTEKLLKAARARRAHWC